MQVEPRPTWSTWLYGHTKQKQVTVSIVSSWPIWPCATREEGVINVGDGTGQEHYSNA